MRNVRATFIKCSRERKETKKAESHKEKDKLLSCF